MLEPFDWLRLCATGSELLATLRTLVAAPEALPEEPDPGPPFTALHWPCRRCRLYPPAEGGYCPFCRTIIEQSRELGGVARRSLLIWGYVNALPDFFWNPQTLAEATPVFYRHDAQHFLIFLQRFDLKEWLRDMLLTGGHKTQGLLQCFPTVGPARTGNMGETLCRVVQQESRYPLDRLRVRFFSTPYQVITPSQREKMGLLTFEAGEFMHLLDAAAIFRNLIQPREQAIINQILNMDNPREERFYWGRLYGHLDQKAKDMLESWGIREWPKNRVRILYELIDYVPYTP